MYRFFITRLRRLMAFTAVNYYVTTKTDRKGITSNSDADVYVWIPRTGWRYYISDKLIKDNALINGLSRSGINFKIFKSSRIGSLTNKIVYLSYSSVYNNKYKFNDYTQELHYIIKQLEQQNNIVFPSSREVHLWENKGFMHQKFKEYNISEPQTELCSSLQDVHELKWEYPFLLKEEHSSASKGVHKISNSEDLKHHEEKNTFKVNEYIIVQKLVDMRRDLRVILVGNEIVHYYWRINNQKQWKPTSTGRGSSVDFDFFPEQWRSFIINEFKKFNIPTGAFDVTWEKDDINSVPLILEISPTYQINPKITNKIHLEEYGKFKSTSFLGKNSYINQYIEQTNYVTEKIVLHNHSQISR